MDKNSFNRAIENALGCIITRGFNLSRNLMSCDSTKVNNKLLYSPYQDFVDYYDTAADPPLPLSSLKIQDSFFNGCFYGGK